MPWDSRDAADAGSVQQLSGRSLSKTLPQLVHGKTSLRRCDKDRFVLVQESVAEVSFSADGKLTVSRILADSAHSQQSRSLVVIGDSASAASEDSTSDDSDSPHEVEVGSASSSSSSSSRGARSRARLAAETFIPPKLTPGMLVRRGPDWDYGNQDASGDGLVLEPMKGMGEGRVHVKWPDGTTRAYRYSDQRRELMAVVEKDVDAAKERYRNRILAEEKRRLQLQLSQARGEEAERDIRKRLIAAGHAEEEVEPVELQSLHDCFKHVGLPLADKDVNACAVQLARFTLPVALKQHLVGLKRRDDVYAAAHSDLKAAISALTDEKFKRMPTAHDLARRQTAMSALAALREKLEKLGTDDETQAELRMVCDMVHCLEVMSKHLRTNSDPSAQVQLGDLGSRLGVTLATFLVRSALGMKFPLRGLPRIQIDGRGPIPTVTASGQDYTVTMRALEYKRVQGQAQMEKALAQLQLSLPTLAMLHHMAFFHTGYPKPHGRVTYELRGTVHFEFWPEDRALLKPDERVVPLPWPDRPAARAAGDSSEVSLVDEDIWSSSLEGHEGASIHMLIQPEDDWSAVAHAEASAALRERDARKAAYRAARRAARAPGSSSSWAKRHDSGTWKTAKAAHRSGKWTRR